MTSQNTPFQPSRKVYFPIIEHVSVDGYVLYPGSDDSPGLSHEFKTGVNVILGINGIGKTTLLLLIYRMLTGDRDLRDGEELGGSQRKLARADQNVFAARVPDKAIDAKATLRFKLNGKSVTISRSLKDLSIESFNLDNESYAITNFEELEDSYKFNICSLAGVDDFFDWVIVLKYLVFYLEDRRSLVWDKWAQTEIFRILFLPESTQSSYKTLLNNALSADSQARNTQAVLSKEEQKLAKLKNDIDKAAPEDLRVLRGQRSGLLARAARLKELLEKLETDRVDYRNNAARLRNDAEKLSQEDRMYRERLLANIFPKLTDYGAYALASIESLRGCLVCGCIDESYLKTVKDKIHEELHCPLCNAEPSLQEKSEISSDIETDKIKLEDITKRLKEVKASANKAEQAASDTLKRFIEIQTESYEIEKELRVADQKLNIAEQAAGLLDSNVIKTTTDRLQVFRDSVSEYKSDKNIALTELKTLIDDISLNVNLFKEKLIDEFQKIISNFLAEKCELTFRTESRNVGQSSSPIDLFFPEFHVLMTSGVFRESGTAREQTSSVSESQKEFIELAFRMSVLSACAGDTGCSLIIETPEANLDAVFIPKAGKALNDFAVQNSLNPSTIIATSNLNGSEMIPALLGILESPEKSDVISGRYLNLLNFAAKSAALREFSDEYNKELQKSLGVLRERN